MNVMLLLFEVIQEVDDLPVHVRDHGALMEPLAEHMRATLVLVVDDNAAPGWRHGLFVADPQRAEQSAIGTLAAKAGLHGGHERAIPVECAIVITALECCKW